MDLPLHVQTLYAELLQQLMASPRPSGSVYYQKPHGKRYAYHRRLVGQARIDSFIGPEADEETAEAIASLNADARLARERARLVRMLTSAGLAKLPAAHGNVLEALQDAGVFASSTLIGTMAYGCYGAVLGVRLPSASLTTHDADIASLSFAIAGAGGPTPMIDILRRADPGFSPLPGLKKPDPPSAFRSPSGFMVDLIIQQRRRADRNPVPLPDIAAGAAPLQHIAWLIEDPIPAAALYRSGVLVRIPQPARFAVHKLVVADKRGAHEAAKRAKDLTQAATLMTILQMHDPGALQDALEDAKAQGKSGWRDPLVRSLKIIARSETS